MENIEHKQGLLRRNLTSSTEKMSSGITGLAAVTDNLIGITDTITEHTQKQTTAVQTLVAGITAYSAIAEQVLATCHGSTGLSEKALDAAIKGKATVQESMYAMERISHVVGAALQAITGLKEKADDINENLRVINGIDHATSMLSLNASIRSIKAGQAGRGFAVVAQEIKHLAERSSSSVDQIQKSVNYINESTTNTVEALNVILKQVEHATESANNVSKIFDSIVAAAEGTNRAFTEINNAVSSQAQSLESVSKTTQSMRDGFDNLAGLVEVGGIYTNFTRNTLQALGHRAEGLKKSTAKLLDGVNNEVPLVLSINVAQEPATFDPQKTFEFNGAQILKNVHMGLLTTDAQSQIAPGVACRWIFDEATNTWTFHLHKGTKFSNGRQVTAIDVKFSLERLMDPVINSPNSWALSSVVGALEFSAGQVSDVLGIQVIDDYRIDIKLQRVDGGFLVNLAQFFTGIVDRKSLEEGEIVGCGPYQILNIDPKFCRLGASGHYAKGAPYVSFLDFKYDTSNLAQSLLEGRYDIVHFEDADVIKGLTSNPEVRIDTKSILGYYYAGFNMKSQNALVQNIEARRALAMAIDRRTMIDNILGGMGEEASGPLPLALFGMEEGHQFPFDSARARDILDPFAVSGTRLRVLVRSDNSAPLFDQLAEFVKESFEKVGIGCDVVEVLHKEYMTEQNLRNVDLFFSRWVADTPEQGNLLAPLFHSTSPTNYCAFENSEVDACLDTAQRAISARKRVELYRQADQLVHEGLPAIFLYYIKMGVAYRDCVSNVGISHMGSLKCEDIFLKKVNNWNMKGDGTLV